MYSNIMTFDIKTINRKNIENNLNTCLDIANMLVKLKKKYEKEYDEDTTCKEYIQKKLNSCLDDIIIIIELKKNHEREDNDNVFM